MKARRCLLLALAALPLLGTLPVQAQHAPAPRQVRVYIPADQLVSFPSEAPFNHFIETLRPLFERKTGKALLDLETRTQPIGVAIERMHFFDAFELVLEHRGLSYRETKDHFIVESKPPQRDTLRRSKEKP